MTVEVPDTPFLRDDDEPEPEQPLEDAGDDNLAEERRAAVSLRVIPEYRASAALRSTTCANRKLIARLRREESTHANRYGKALGGAFKALGRDIVVALGLSGTTKAGVESWPDGLQSITDDMLQQLVPSQLSLKYLLPIFTRQYALIGEATWDAVDEIFGTGVSWDLDDPHTCDLIRRGGTRAGLVDLDRQTRQAVLDALADEREDGGGWKLGLRARLCSVGSRACVLAHVVLEDGPDEAATLVVPDGGPTTTMSRAAWSVWVDKQPSGRLVHDYSLIPLALLSEPPAERRLSMKRESSANSLGFVRNVRDSRSGR